MNVITISTQMLFGQAIAANLFMDGGPVFMTLILISLLAALGCLVKGFLTVKKSLSVAYKSLKLAVDFSLLALVMGFLGSVIGLISAFDSVEAMGSPTPEMFASGLKISLLTATFGLFSFIISRIGIIILRMMLPSEDISA
ncbi:MAG: MotA/TolQ/ExbB proton channel family protein [Psychroserpens sp.]|uniref:MotA/TolQ/ExbB proton channel family protein n=1 Tax=Psychroserpens sp. TaxID=2020870 RepID=UPI003C783A12